MKMKQLIPYRLCIQTDDYTGNFERELVGYSTGILDEVTESLISKFDPDDYCKHWFYQDVMCMNEKSYYSRIKGGESPLLRDYLCETYQEVDDWEQSTFYYINPYFDDKNSVMPDGSIKCNSLYLQLVKPLPPIWEEIIIGRIVKFFKDERIRKEEFSCLKYAEWDKRHLVNITLIDDENNVVKQYDLSKYGYPIIKDYFKLTQE